MLSVPTLIVISILFLVLLLSQFLWMRNVERELLALRKLISVTDDYAKDMFEKQIRINQGTSETFDAIVVLVDNLKRLATRSSQK